MPGRVLGHDEEGGVTLVEVGGGVRSPCPSLRSRPAGAAVTLAIRAEDVLVAVAVPQGLSARNVYEARMPGSRARAPTSPCAAFRERARRAEWMVRVTPSAVASLGPRRRKRASSWP